MTTRRTVAFVGLGAMGRPMASHVASSSDVSLRVFDVAEQAMAMARGIGQPAASLVEAVTGADVVVTMLPADRNVEQVASVLLEVGSGGQVLVDLSTIHPSTIEKAGEELSQVGVAVVSGTCMKSVAAAERGELTIFVGADRAEVLDQVVPVLEVMSSVCLDVGSLRAAKVLKLINNLQVAGLNLVISEAMLVGRRAGVAYEETVEALRAAGRGGWPLENQTSKHVIPGDLGPGRFPVRYMAKDVRLAAAVAEDYGQPRFLAGLLLAAFRGAESLGLADHYHPIIIQWLESCVGTSGAAATPSRDEILHELVGWVEAAEFLIASHGLAIAEVTGSNPQEAARYLLEASAATESLKSLAGGPADRERLEVVMSSVARALEMADAFSVPAVTMESAYDYCKELLEG